VERRRRWTFGQANLSRMQTNRAPKTSDLGDDMEIFTPITPAIHTFLNSRAIYGALVQHCTKISLI